MARLVVWICAVCVACSEADEPAPPPPPPVPSPHPAPAPSPAPPVVKNRVAMRTDWSEISASAGCWYFSGPNGRDTRLAGPITLVRDGNKVTATLGGATFTGTYRDSELDLSRDATHRFDDLWTTHERIHGAFKSGKITGHYHYEECEQGTRCPNHCTIEATLELSAI